MLIVRSRGRKAVADLQGTANVVKLLDSPSEPVLVQSKRFEFQRRGQRAGEHGSGQGENSAHREHHGRASLLT